MTIYQNDENSQYLHYIFFAVIGGSVCCVSKSFTVLSPEHSMRDISSRFGVMVSFEKPVYMNGLFQGFDGWDAMNARFGANNITYIVRVEFELPSFKENRIKRRFRLFWSVAKKVDPGLYIKVDCMYKMLCMAKLPKYFARFYKGGKWMFCTYK